MIRGWTLGGHVQILLIVVQMNRYRLVPEDQSTARADAAVTVSILFHNGSVTPAA